MRRYDDQVVVRTGLVSGQEAPVQFIWRGGSWWVVDVVAHWVETRPWWGHTAGTATDTAVSTAADPAGGTSGDPPVGARGGSSAGGPGGPWPDEREVWRVAAARHGGRSSGGALPEGGWADGGQAGAGQAEGGQAGGGNAEGERTGGEAFGGGVFDLAFDWGGGQWRLVTSID